MLPGNVVGVPRIPASTDLGTRAGQLQQRAHNQQAAQESIQRHKFHAENTPTEQYLAEHRGYSEAAKDSYRRRRAIAEQSGGYLNDGPEARSIIEQDKLRNKDEGYAAYGDPTAEPVPGVQSLAQDNAPSQAATKSPRFKEPSEMSPEELNAAVYAMAPGWRAIDRKIQALPEYARANIGRPNGAAPTSMAGPASPATLSPRSPIGDYINQRLPPTLEFAQNRTGAGAAGAASPVPGVPSTAGASPAPPAAAAAKPVPGIPPIPAMKPPAAVESAAVPGVPKIPSIGA
jgi:hypothetical protein